MDTWLYNKCFFDFGAIVELLQKILDDTINAQLGSYPRFFDVDLVPPRKSQKKALKISVFDPIKKPLKNKFIILLLDECHRKSFLCLFALFFFNYDLRFTM